MIEIVTPLIIAHHNEEKRRFEEFPAELEKAKKEQRTAEFQVKQRDKKLKVIMLESSNVGMPGFLRSQNGGKYDVVVQRTQQGYVNILTRPAKRIDLRSLTGLIRLSEAEHQAIPLDQDPHVLIATGRIDSIKNWYYDTATNSILNGGILPTPDITPTTIPWNTFQKILELGLSEQIIDPRAL